MNSIIRTLVVALLVVASACVGSVSGEYERRGDGSPFGATDDSAVPPGDVDGGTTEDGGDDADIPRTSDAGAGDARVDSGAPPTGACEGVSCGAGAACNPATGACECAAGFIVAGMGCEPIPVGDPQGRSRAEVCGAWTAGHVENARPAWTAGPTACDSGTMDPAAYDDTTRRVNLFRWLTGLPAVTHDSAQNDSMQECAVMMNEQGRLSHNPPTSWACYTAAGAAGAGSSNLALGTSSPAHAIDLYMGDAGVASLGHRRWILSNRLGRVGIGFAGRAQCLRVFDSSGLGDREWTSFPNPGPAPVETTGFVWSFNSHTIDTSSATVSMERLTPTREEIAVTTSHMRRGSGPPGAVGWRPSSRALAGETYRITIGGLSDADISYEVDVVDCP